MPVRRGPAVVVPIGAECELFDSYMIECLYMAGRILPDPDVPAMVECIIVRPWTAEIDGLWRDMRPGELLRLSRSEMHELMRQRRVRPTDAAIFHLPGLVRA
jgi:hypothetical protein